MGIDRLGDRRRTHHSCVVEIWRNHPGNACRGRFAERQPQILAELLAALLDAARYCDNPQNAADIAAILARPEYLNVDAAYIRASLPSSNLATRGEVDRSVFAAHSANTPSRAHALWFLSQMARWNYLPRTIDAKALTEKTYRPELLHPRAASRR